MARNVDLDRREFLRAAGLAGAAAVLGGPLAAARETEPAHRPNIVLIVGDDLGYADLGVQGCKDIPTPNIDSIAANGVRFTNGYVSCPVCSPTRAGLMTGRYQERFGHEFNPGPATKADPDFGLSLSEKTIAERLKPLGYATGMFGKWHLGYQPKFHPLQRGFDEFYGFLGGAHSYIAVQDNNDPILRGTEPVAEIDYTTDAFAREAVSFIDRHAAAPFFVYLPFNAVHNPPQVPEKYLARFAHIADGQRRRFAAMLSAMDDNVGLVLAKLREHDLDRDTLVIFISDNGGPTPQTSSANDPLRGYKAEVLEGGIRVPFMMQWPGRVPTGKVYSQPVISLDICPTILAAAGEKVPQEVDGVDLAHYVKHKTLHAPHKRLFWRYGKQYAIREGDWKLVKAKDEPVALYDLAHDIHEDKNLAAEQPKKLAKLQAAYDEWNATLAPPKWGQAPATQAPAKQRAKKGKRT